jgi:general nucleoside transport system permease protein
VEALLDSALRLAAPLLLAALGELLVERAGVLNIGVEGMMLTGAFAAFVAAVATGSPAVGVLAGGAAACALGAFFAFFAVVRRIDQIVVGTAINLLALGATGVGVRAIYPGGAPTAPTVGDLLLPGLATLPIFGRSLSAQSPFVYGGIFAAAAIALFLRSTRLGLRLRAVGESARAADAEGANVMALRVCAVLAGALMAGIAGANLSLAQSNSFTEGMTAGRGFIALAVVIFGGWRPSGIALAAVFFGSASALQFRLQASGVAIPYPAFLMFPYLVTLAVLAFATRRTHAPEDLGRPYRREAG